MTVTGGYILGFVPALAIVGFQADKNNLATFTSSLGTYLVALMVVYLSGFIWLVQYAGVSATQAYVDGVQATFVGDVVEITAVAALVGLFSQLFKRSAQ
jgi:biotin transporter BioY